MSDSLERLLEALKRHEGFRPFVYDDATGERIGPGSIVKGHPTIGFGWALDKTPMTRGFADAALRHLVHVRLLEVNRRLAWVKDLDDVRQAALYELAYNLGVDGLLGFVKMLEALRVKQYQQARAELLDSKWAREDVSPERAAAIGYMVQAGEWPAG